MTNIYQIVSMKHETTKSGKNLIRATLALSGSEGEETEGVTIWEGFPNFGVLKVGSPVSGDIVTKQNGEFVNKTLFAPRGVSPRKTKGDSERGSIAVAMEKKAEGIEKAQDRKADAIKLAGCNRDATIMVAQELSQMTALGTEWSQADAQIKWKEWQKWFMGNYGDGVPFI